MLVTKNEGFYLPVQSEISPIFFLQQLKYENIKYKEEKDDQRIGDDIKSTYDQAQQMSKVSEEDSNRRGIARINKQITPLPWSSSRSLMFLMEMLFFPPIVLL